MRLLFVSGTTVGGSGRSQRELAARLLSRGHDVLILADDERPANIARWAYGHLSDLAVRWGEHPGGRIIRAVEGMPGRRVEETELGRVHHRLTPIPENAVADAIAAFRPDVVVGNSVLRLTWRKTREICRREEITTVLYVREAASLNHFMLGEQPATRIVANARSLVGEVERMGYPCAFIPSVIETDVTKVKTDRRVALAINPLPSHGSELLWTLARRLPEIQFVIRESWPLRGPDLLRVVGAVSVLPNVEFHRLTEPGSHLYDGVRVLLVPHRIDNRPRVVVEAQANGIPVIASDLPGLREATGPGGAIIDMDDVEAWIEALRTLWTDESAYTQAMSRAEAHSRRPEIDPERVCAAFEALVNEAIDDTRHR